MKTLRSAFLVLGVIGMIFSACKKDEETETVVSATKTTGITTNSTTSTDTLAGTTTSVSIIGTATTGITTSTTDTTSNSEPHDLIEKKILISEVIDAEYSKSTNKLVYVSSNSKLYLFDGENETLDSINLTYTPTCISVSSDGKTAVVGHNGYISYIDMISKNVIRTYAVSIEVFDIVLDNKFWAYAFPSSRASILSLNVGNPNAKELMTDIFSYRNYVKLHPTGDYIYGTTTTTSPGDIQKFDIKNDTIKLMYDSPYHGDYKISGKPWISEDGTKIFTGSGEIFKSSVIKNEDLIYEGKIEFERDEVWDTHGIQSLADVKSADKVFIIIREPYSSGTDLKPFIYIHNYSNGLLKNKIPLEQYYLKAEDGISRLYDSDAQFVFTNSDGSKAFVLSNVVNYFYTNRVNWSIQSFSID